MTEFYESVDRQPVRRGEWGVFAICTAIAFLDGFDVQTMGVAAPALPFANAHAIAKYLLSRAVRDSGIKVVLTGEGSDEIFAGYPHFRRDLVLYGSNGLNVTDKVRLLAELDAANRASAGTLLPQGSTTLDGVHRVLGFVPSSLET